MVLSGIKLVYMGPKNIKNSQKIQSSFKQLNEKDSKISKLTVHMKYVILVHNCWH